MRSTIYICGPMSKFKDTDWNYPAFHRAASEWRKFGWNVLNPAESFGGRTDLPYERYMKNAVTLVKQANAIALLPGWAESEGAKLEVLLGQKMGYEFYDALTGEFLLDVPQVVTALVVQ